MKPAPLFCVTTEEQTSGSPRDHSQSIRASRGGVRETVVATRIMNASPARCAMVKPKGIHAAAGLATEKIRGAPSRSRTQAKSDGR
jgi:hypothetical protein